MKKTMAGEQDRRLKKWRGFTLIELLLAMLFITLMILTCYIVITNSYYVIRYGEGDMTSIHIANRQIEVFRASFSAIPPVGGPYNRENYPTGYNFKNLLEDLDINGQVYQTTTMVSRVRNSGGYNCPPSRIKQVTVSVSRRLGAKKLGSRQEEDIRTITLNTYVPTMDY